MEKVWKMIFIIKLIFQSFWYKFLILEIRLLSLLILKFNLKIFIFFFVINITNNQNAISYDLITNDSKIKNIEQWKHFINNSFRFKKFWKYIKKFITPSELIIADFNDYSFDNYKKDLLKISDNRCYIFLKGRDFNFLEINLRGNEDIFNNVKKLADLFDDDKKIIIK